VEDNTVNGKPLVYLEDVSDYKVEDAGQVILINCNNITIENLDLSNTDIGIALWKTENSKISNNTVCNNDYYGIRLYDSSNNNTITGNNVSNNNEEGIRLYSSSNNNTITGNNVSNNNDEGILLYNSCNNSITANTFSNRYGIVLSSSSNNNTITGNNVSNNRGGILLYNSCNNSITANTFSNRYGIYLYSSSNNRIYFNNFINNSDNVDYYKSTNIWNSPLEISYTYDGTTYKSYLGNYWDDYEGTDADGDGIGDTHYSIYSENDESDVYPLMKPFENYIISTSAHA
jgi:parallel beta-helix repeat protein